MNILFCCTLPLTTVLMTPTLATAQHTNRLINEQSPYLLQHAHNPVDWYPWSQEAFAKAKQEGKLIFLSIGYSTCHWCHVMEAESFEDEDVAAMLKRDYIAIKVDREERPDIDQFYMQIAIRMHGSGGWPLTIVMTPDKTPVFAGTYFPKETRFNRPGLMEVLPQIADIWKTDPVKLRQHGEEVVNTLKLDSNDKLQNAKLTEKQYEQAEATFRQNFDPQFGGFGKAPKFPSPHTLSFLLQRYNRSRDKELLHMVETTLEKMRDGGIYDHIGLGFHRYATDAQWLVPHFEKMLYDQAGLARVYLEAYQVTKKEDYKLTAQQIFAYVIRQLRDPKGGFYSAEDADSNGVEGQFYVWQKQEILDILGKKRGEQFAAIFNVLETGNFSEYIPGEPAGTNILHRTQSLQKWAKELHLPIAELRQQLEDDRQKLFAHRENRIHPFRDDKVITAWNGQMISALALGARVLDDPQLLKSAQDAAHFIQSKMVTKEGRLLRRWRNGQAAIDAFASDYAFLARGLLDLYRASFNPEYLQQAIDLGKQLATHFTDQRGELFETTADSELPLRTSELYDGALPSAGSVTIEVYARLYLMTGNKQWSDRADSLLKSAAAQINRYPAGYTQFLLGASLLLEPTRELVVVGSLGANDTLKLLNEVQHNFMPETIVLLRPVEKPEAIDAMAPFIEGMEQIDDHATAYLCQGFACQKPQTEPKELRKLLLMTAPE